MKRSSQIMPKTFLFKDDVIDDVTGWPQSFPLYSCLGKVGSGSKLQGQCLLNKCQYHNCLSMWNMPKDDLNEQHFSRFQVKGQYHRLTPWPLALRRPLLCQFWKYQDDTKIDMWEIVIILISHTAIATIYLYIFNIFIQGKPFSYTVLPWCPVTK